MDLEKRNGGIGCPGVRGTVVAPAIEKPGAPCALPRRRAGRARVLSCGLAAPGMRPAPPPAAGRAIFPAEGGARGPRPLLLIWALLIVFGAEAVDRPLPPSAQLAEEATTLLPRAELLGVLDGFAVFRGEAAGGGRRALRLALDEATLAVLEPGTRYCLVLEAARASERPSVARNPLAGPLVVEAPGGAASLLPSLAALAASDLLAAVDAAHPLRARVLVAELLGRGTTELRAATGDLARTLESKVADPRIDGLAREALLLGGVGTHWGLRGARRALAGAPGLAGAAVGTAAFQRSALDVLRRQGGAGDIAVVRPWVEAGDPVVQEAAGRALAALLARIPEA